MFEILGQVIVGWLLADFIGGFLHWYEDRVAWPKLGFLEKYFWEPNRLHHDKPLVMLESSLLSRTSTTLIVVSFLATAWWLIWGPSVMLVAAFIGGAIQNEVHGWTHKAPKSAFLRALQQTGFLQSPVNHAKHHRPPYQSSYCILTDWINPILDYIRFWPRLERLLHFRREL